MNFPWYAHPSQFIDHLGKKFYWGRIPEDWIPWVWGVLAVSLVFFLVALWPKIRVLRLAESENRIDHLGARFWNTLWIAFGQSKMFKDGPAGWMHALIFWGFLVLLFRALQFFFIGLFPMGLFFLHYETSLLGQGAIP